ncbi:toll/interleukin-1 receptor domain-containing protein [Microbacterium lacticum]
MSDKHVFLSYIREDKAHADDLQKVLEAAGFNVWRDKDKLFPGDNWALKIRQAIQGGSFIFLACFSTALSAREVSYQNEELVLAAAEYRLRPMDTSWLMTVRFDECSIPPVDLGMGRSLDRTIHRTDLFAERKTEEIARLVMAINRVIQASPGAPSPAVLEAVAGAARADDTSLDRLRDLIRNPGLLMDYDSYMVASRKPVVQALADRERFPMEGRPGPVDVAVARDWTTRLHDYESVIAPLMEPMKLICGYGQTVHQDELGKTMRAIGQESIQSSGLNLQRAQHEYPTVVLTYVCALAAESKRNYGMLRAATADVVVTELGKRSPFITLSGSQSVTSNWNWLGSIVYSEDENEPVEDNLIAAFAADRAPVRYTPISDHIYTLLAPLFTEQFVSDDEYAEAFDRVEVIFDAVTADFRIQNGGFYGGGGGYGRYTYRYQYTDIPVEKAMLEDARAAGAGWTPLLGGMFGGDTDRAIAALERVADVAAHKRSGQH